MIKQFAGTITSFLIHENIINEDDYEIYNYGTEQILINLATLLVVSIIATITNSWVETIFFLIGMVPIRAVAGGFHANTQMRCNVLTVFVFILNISIINLLKNYINFYLLLALLSFILFSIIKYAPVDHKNMELKEEEFISSKRKSRIIGITIYCVCISLALAFNSNNLFIISTTMGALTASISLIIGSMMQGGERNEDCKYIP